MTDLLDRSDLDTWLARFLLWEGRISQADARALLEGARAERAQGGSTLARTLVGRGLFSQVDLERVLEQSPAAQPPLTSLQHLGPYELLEELGAGGMGKVYRARQRETGVECALKTLLDLDAEGLARFQREGEGQARVDDHPNVVKIHTLGQENGVHYLVMDLIPGGSLEERLRAAAPTPEQAAGWVRALASALEFAHQRGVLHRDIKPANVLFDGERPLLVDFGLVKLADARSLTETGAVLGTPGYMAPEQVDRSRGAVGPPTDVYGLGALLYRCLAGREPFAAATPWMAMLQVLEQPPTPPRELQPEVPPALEAVCLRCLEKEPERRYPSAAALIEAIDAALDPDSTTPPRGVAALGALGLMLAVGGIVAFAALQSAPSTQAPRPSEVVPSSGLVVSSPGAVAPSPSAVARPGSPPPMVQPKLLPPLPAPHRYDGEIIAGLWHARPSRKAEALLRLRRILSGPRTQATAAAHRNAAVLLEHAAQGRPEQVQLSRQAIVHAALTGDAKAATILANHHVPLADREQVHLYSSWEQRPEYSAVDLPLAAAALALARHWPAGARTAGNRDALIKKLPRSLPPVQTAYEHVWNRCPEGRASLPPVEPPTDREAVWSTSPPPALERQLRRYRAGRREGLTVSPKPFEAEFQNLPGQLSGELFRELARIAASRVEQLDLLARAAVAGDAAAAILLARAHGAKVSPIDNLGWSLQPRKPDRALARACLVLAMTTRDDGLKMIAGPLLGTGTPTPASIRAAYRVLWDRFPGAR